MGMTVLLSQLFKIVAMVLVGFVLKKRKIMTNEMQSGLSNMLLVCILPMDILAAGNNEFDAALSRGMLLTAVIAVVYYIASSVIMWLFSRKLPLQGANRNLFVVLAVFANVGFVGYPLMKGLYGIEGYMYTVVYNFAYQISIATIGVKLMDKSAKINFKGFLTSPLIIAPVFSIAMYLSPWRMPTLVVEVLSQIGGMMVPLSMLILGGSLADISFASILKDKWSYVISALRLVIFPLLMLLVLWVLGIGGVAAATCVVLTGLCGASLSVIFAQRYQLDVAFATRSVMLSMLFMVLSLPLLFILINATILA